MNGIGKWRFVGEEELVLVAATADYCSGAVQKMSILGKWEELFF
jgi:hypothetical protein